MANGTKHTTSNGRTPWENISRETFGLGVAEFASMGVSLGTVALADTIAPDLLKSASKTVGKVCIEPYLDTIENGLHKVCKLEECQPDMTKPKSERAEQLAHTIIVFSAAFATSLIAKLATRKLMNHALDVGHKEKKHYGNWFKDKLLFRWLDPHDWKVVLADESVHLGSFFLVNNGAAKHTDNAINAVSSILEKTFGMSKDRANAVASMAVVWELPNAIGFAAGTGVIMHDHLKKPVSEASKNISAALNNGNGHTPTT